jgi:hypothetical protein
VDQGEEISAFVCFQVSRPQDTKAVGIGAFSHIWVKMTARYLLRSRHLQNQDSAGPVSAILGVKSDKRCQKRQAGPVDKMVAKTAHHKQGAGNDVSLQRENNTVMSEKPFGTPK